MVVEIGDLMEGTVYRLGEYTFETYKNSIDYVYNNGKILGIEEAYESGILTDEDAAIMVGRMKKYYEMINWGILCWGHNATCLYCNYSDFYEHNWVWIPHIALYKCSVCPQTTAIIPTPGINSIPGDSEELIVALPPSDDKEGMAE